MGHLWSVGLLIIANGLILGQAPPELRSGAAFILLSWLPGWVWWPFFYGSANAASTQNRCLSLSKAGQPSLSTGSGNGYYCSIISPEFLTRLIFSVGLSLALTILSTLGAVYLPGPLTASRLLVILNFIIISGLLITWRNPQSATNQSVSIDYLPLAISLLLIAGLILAAGLRLPRLGYAEFHEDEAEALMLGVRLLQGEDYALFLHRKGPAQMLLPVAFWLLTDQLTETLARLPFALSSLLSVLTLTLLAGRWFGWPAGLIAGLLWAVNGYAVAFGRMVQYQAIIFFLGPLALYGLYLAGREARFRLTLLAALLLATCLLAHFDALLLLPAAGYLSWRVYRQPNSSPAMLLMAGLLFGLLLATFYIPYFLDPEFTHTTHYLTESRIKPGWLYNNLALLQRLDAAYSSPFYLPILAIGGLWFVLLVGEGSLKRLLRTSGIILNLTFGLSFLASLTTMWQANLWRIGQLNLAMGPWGLTGLLAFILVEKISQTVESRAMLLMVGAPFLGYGFLVDDPRTHLYILYPGAVVMAGFGWSQISRLLVTQWQRWLLYPVGLIWLIGVGAYLWLIFLQTESALNRVHREWSASIWASVYDELPAPREYFGYPKRVGWKTIGALRTAGHLPGDFRSVNEDFIVPIWYTYGEPRSCYETPAHFFLRTSETDWQPPAEYQANGQVVREGETQLQIFSASYIEPIDRATYQLADYEAAFDQLATPQQFIHQAEPAQLVGTQFGPAIRFVGYDLPTTTVSPGEVLRLSLYWQALTEPGDYYRAFVHLTDGQTLWGQQDDNPVCRLPTTIWRAGQRGRGQFRLTLPADMPPGRYPLIIGLYQAETLERLPITQGPGQIGDDFLWLGDIEVDTKVEQ